MIRWTLAFICVVIGYFLLDVSLRAHGWWQVFVADGNLELARPYRTEFWTEFISGLVLVLLGAFLAGSRFGRG